MKFTTKIRNKKDRVNKSLIPNYSLYRLKPFTTDRLSDKRLFPIDRIVERGFSPSLSTVYAGIPSARTRYYKRETSSRAWTGITDRIRVFATCSTGRPVARPVHANSTELPRAEYVPPSFVRQDTLQNGV